MADPLSAAASIVGLIGLADRVIRASQYCIDTVRDAPGDMRMILGEASSLRAVFESLADAGSGPATGLLGANGPVEACRRCLAGLEALLPADRRGSARRVTLAELAWPFKQPKARKFLAEISQHKATLLLAISGDVLHELRDIKTGLERVQDAMSDSQRRQVSEWLERTNPSYLHNAAVEKHEPLTSSWLVRSPEWASWLEPSTTDRLLWIYGIPGAGKTVLASFAVEELKKMCQNRPGYVCAYYYCHYSHNEDEAAPFLRWVVSQVCRQTKRVSQRLRAIHDSGCNPTMPELQQALEEALGQVDSLYVVVDAVDESSPRESLVRLIATLALDGRFCKVRIGVTSRQYLEIERVFSGISISMSMSNPLVDVDIRRFTHAKLAASYRLQRWQHWHRDIEEALVAGARGMFRWADCQIRAIERIHDEQQLHAALQNLPPDLTETYARIFDAIPEPDRHFVRRLLVWICGHARAPWGTQDGLRADLLLSAVAYELYGSSLQPAFDCDYLQELLGCLITAYPEDGALVVSLAHYTVLEFLTSPHILQTRVAFFSLPLATIDSEFAVSVLRQALAADAAGTSASWEHDREAYCLTLGAALGSFGGDEVQRLLVQYLNPASPHYARFCAIQERIQLDDNDSFGFYLGNLPGAVSSPSAPGGHDVAAEVLMNILLLPDPMLFHMSNIISFVKKSSGGRSLRDLLDVSITGFSVEGSPNGELKRVFFEGTVREVAGSERFGRQGAIDWALAIESELCRSSAGLE